MGPVRRQLDGMDGSGLSDLRGAEEGLVQQSGSARSK